MTELHITYAPILRFNRDERFFPMRLEEMLAYASLYAKEQPQPIVGRGDVTPAHLSRIGRSPDVFLRSVSHGPLVGKEVVANWGDGVLEMVCRFAATPFNTLPERLARRAYHWFSPQTRPATDLFWWNGLVQHVVDNALISVPENTLPRLILPAITEEAAISAYETAVRATPAYTYYYRQILDQGYLCLQYWFFYSYNNWGRRFGGLNDHEGDWEGMMLFFRLDPQGHPQEPPAYVTFADHESRQTRPWGHPDVTLLGTHPVGFVAGGSHATYPQAKTHPLMQAYNLFDYATGDGRTIDHDQWQHRLNLDTLPWVSQYAGSYGTRFWLNIHQTRAWLDALLFATPLPRLLAQHLPDEIELPGVSAPRGPLHPNRPQNATPTTWAGVTP